MRTGHRAVNKIAQKTLGRRVLRPVERYDWWSPAASRQSAMRALRNGSGRPLVDELQTAPLFHRERLAAFFAVARGSEFADPAALGRILTAELALRAVGTSIEDAT
jgi:hypothetical protein